MDTSLTKSGWAIITVADRKPTLTAYGLIKSTAKLSDGERLRQIHTGITDVIAHYPDIERTIPREEGIVRHNLPTRQVFKAHGVFEFALSEFEIVDLNIQTVKAWARKVTRSDGKRNDKEMVSEAVKIFFKDPSLNFNKGGDESDAIAVTLVYLLRNKLID